jgi:hypothetical protein
VAVRCTPQLEALVASVAVPASWHLRPARLLDLILRHGENHTVWCDAFDSTLEQIDLVKATEPVFHQTRIEQEIMLSARGRELGLRVPDFFDRPNLLVVPALHILAWDQTIILVGKWIPRSCIGDHKGALPFKHRGEYPAAERRNRRAS